MIYIVRHGQTDFNLEKRITGRLDIPLNETGIKEASIVKEKLKDIKFDYVFVSPLIRAIKTAEIITNQEKFIDNRLIERYNGDLEGKIKRPDIDYKSSLNNLEPIEDMSKRVKSFFDEIKEKYPQKNILVVTHGGVIINVRYYFEGQPKSGSIEEYLTGNCEIIKYDN